MCLYIGQGKDTGGGFSVGNCSGGGCHRVLDDVGDGGCLVVVVVLMF